jgi:rare lipoprotein A
MRKIIATAVAGMCAFALPSESRSTMLASWYGPGFHGRTTANGEKYDMHGLTAAHKDLPFGTQLRVCYQRCVDVRINDRGPYIGARELDLSYGAAQAVGLIASGVANVEVSYL